MLNDINACATSARRTLRSSENLHHFAHLRDGFTHFALDAHFQGHRAAGAASAGTLQAHFHHGTIDFHHFHVAAVGHQEWTQLIKHLFNVLTGEWQRL